MIGVRRGLAGLVLAAPFVLGAAAAESPQTGEVVLTLTDPEIVESSGLALVPGADPPGTRLLATVNDSGDGARVFAVDPETGRTVGVTWWRGDGDPRDVEAVAPAGPGEVWVADIGDNLRARESIEISRVPVGRGTVRLDAPRTTLVWPDGPRDAEALLVHPRTGRVLVVSKGVFGGEVAAVPERPDLAGPTPLTVLGEVAGMVTDGAFWPDGRHLVLRTYEQAHVYRYPELEHVGAFDLPPQPQGEGLAVTDDGEVWISTEGGRSEVLRVPVPRGVLRALEGQRLPTWWQRILEMLVPRR